MTFAGAVLACLMSIDHNNHDSSVPTARLATDPHDHPFAFEAAFNAGNPEALYEPDAVLVRGDGVTVTREGLHANNVRLMALGSITVRPRRIEVAGELALLIVDWVIAAKPDPVEGTATDVARRGADGFWRYVIDNPFGIAQRALPAG
ncbi:protein of unknown function [Prauserella marina]|uniref:Uncharacterized protein n=2 Tax=Prauserella marina TaxID=530584 RepID=A0A1G6WT62_9PSEU|nr:uncharacterized protein DUF4440 [Prauserella marina]SDD69078.1 protein of unknown function [Prauserella marina]